MPGLWAVAALQTFVKRETGGQKGSGPAVLAGVAPYASPVRGREVGNVTGGRKSRCVGLPPSGAAVAVGAEVLPSDVQAVAWLAFAGTRRLRWLVPGHDLVDDVVVRMKIVADPGADHQDGVALRPARRSPRSMRIGRRR